MIENMSIEHSANWWHMRVKEGLSIEEQKEFNEWLAIEVHSKAYEKTQRLIGRCLALDEAFVKELEEEIMRDDAVVHSLPSNVWYKRRSFFATLAACLILFVGITFQRYYFEPTFNQSYVTSDQKILDITLPDTSRIDLDIKSSLHVTYFNHKRTVEIKEGKVFFDVAKDAHKPYIIQAGETTIEVVGTKFEVLHVNHLTTINVQDGIVKVSDQGQKAFYQLKKAESITFNDMGKMLYYGQINSQKIATWKEDVLFFDATTLKDATAEFAYYTDQNVTFENDTIALLKLTGTFQTTHFQGFIEAIEMIYGLKVKKENEGIKLVRK